MSFALTCPNCGKRPVAEFRFGGEHNDHGGPNQSPEEWAEQLYLHKNADGPQDEWWYHRFGCRSWFMAHRDTHDNKVLATWWPDEERPAHLGIDDAGAESQTGEGFSEP